MLLHNNTGGKDRTSIHYFFYFCELLLANKKILIFFIELKTLMDFSIFEHDMICIQ